MTNAWTREQLEHVIRFTRPEKRLGSLPGAARLDEGSLAALFGTDRRVYEGIVGWFREEARAAAAGLLADGSLAAQVAALPFRPGDTVVGLGDSLTDDRLSWLELLRHLLAAARPNEAIEIVNAGISGNTTVDLVSRFLAVADLNPQWVVVLIGTNDARRHGYEAAGPLVSPAETRKNLEVLRTLIQSRTPARIIWMTPPPVMEERHRAHWQVAPAQIWYLDRDLAPIRDSIRAMPDPVVDLEPLLGGPKRGELLIDDGIHLSLAGQQAVVRALVRELSSP